MITTVDTVALWLNRESLDPMETLLAGALITQVEGVINAHCGWHLLAKDYSSKLYDGNGSDEISLGAYPINSLDKVLIDGTDVTADIVVDEEAGALIYPGRGFSAGRLNISVDFNAGFSPVPGGLEYCALQLIIPEFLRVTEGRTGIKTETFKDVSVTFTPDTLPPRVAGLLQRYTNVNPG